MNNNTHNTNDIPEEVSKLIPWFAIEKLSVEDQAFFEKALLSNPSLKQQINAEQQLIEAVTKDKSILDGSLTAYSTKRMESVLYVIDSQEQLKKGKTQLRIEAEGCDTFFYQIKSALHNFTESLAFKPQYAFVASFSVMVLSVAVISSYMHSSDTNSSDFRLASAKSQQIDNQKPSTKATKTVLLVGFKGTSSELSNNKALKGKQIKIDSPADKDGFFQVSFNQSMSADQIKQTIDDLLAQEEMVWFAGEAF